MAEGPGRLDRLLANAGVGTRSQVKKLIRSGAVTVNGAAAEPETKVDPSVDVILCGGKRIGAPSLTYVMLNKPCGVVCATRDEKYRTVIDLVEGIPEAGRLFPSGRLDIDTVGLVLLTDDGSLSHSLLSPRSHVEKEYEARLARQVTEEDIKAFADGMDIGDKKPCLPAILTDCTPGEDETPLARVVIREGRFHQVKRMFEKTGNKVTGLKRLRIGSLVLDESLPEGGFRYLTDSEISSLKFPEEIG